MVLSRPLKTWEVNLRELWQGFVNWWSYWKLSVACDNDMTMISCLSAKSELCKYCKNLKMPLHFSWLIHFSHFSRLASWRERAKGTERGWEESSFPKYLILKSTDQVTKKMAVVQDKLSILDEGLEKVGRFFQRKSELRIKLDFGYGGTPPPNEKVAKIYQ